MKSNSNKEKKNLGNKPITDERFTKAQSDPRFSKIGKKKSKVKLDPRFKSVLSDPNFQTTTKIDKRGKITSSDTELKQLKKIYEVDDDQSAIKEDVPDSEESEEENDVPEEKEYDSSDIENFEFVDNEEDLEDWSDFEKDADIPTGDATKRIAVMNCDWDHLKAVDILVLLQSFIPPGGFIKSVSIFPSDFGIQKMKEEEEKGPDVLWVKKEDGSEEVDKHKLREYELNRLKYYFAVVECDSLKTSISIYENCDGQEIERTSNLLDLRYIPDDVTFDRKPIDSATEVPNDYKAPNWYTKALQHTNVELSWDAPDSERAQITMKAFTKDDLEDAEYKIYLAEPSDDESSEDEVDTNDAAAIEKKKEKIRSKYAALLEGMNGNEAEEKEDMEITFTAGLADDASKLVQKKKMEKDETVFEKKVREAKEKKKEKKKQKKLEEAQKKEEEEENGGKKKKKNKTKKLSAEEEEEEARKKAELELILMSDKPAKNDTMAKLEMDSDEEKLKGKAKRKAKKQEEANFKIDLDDQRWKPLLENPDFAPDPTHKKFKATNSTKEILTARSKKRTEILETEAKAVPVVNEEKQGDLLQFAESVKRKAAKALKQDSTKKQKK